MESVIISLQRDNELIEIEKRNFFSLLCLDLEAQLIHVNLAQLPEIFHNLVSAQVKGHTQVKMHTVGLASFPGSPHCDNFELSQIFLLFLSERSKVNNKNSQCECTQRGESLLQDIVLSVSFPPSLPHPSSLSPLLSPLSLSPQYQSVWSDMRGVVDTMRASLSGQASLLTPTHSPTSSLTHDTPSPFV